MADTKITALTALTGADPANDVIPIVDVSDTTMAASGTTKKISVNNILGASGTATLASATITGDLTVDTSTLKVDSANDRVGINKLSPAATLDVFGSARFGGSNYMEFGSANNLLSSFASTGAQLRTVISTAAAPTYSWTGDSSTGLFNPSASVIGFTLGGSEAMRLNSTGLGVGQVPSTSKLEVGITNTSTAGLIEANALKIENNNATVNNAAGLFLSQTGNAGCGIAGIATSRTGGSRTSALALYYYNQATSASPIEGARLDASGRLLVGTTSAIGKVSISYAYPNIGIGLTTDSNSAQTAIQFNTPAGLAGYINTSSTTTTYNSASDYRLKESVQPLVGGLARVSALKPSIYKWKADGSSGEGFLAHELAEVVPAAVSGEKDAVNEDGSIKPQGVDMSRVVPILVAAIQELAAEVNALKNA